MKNGREEERGCVDGRLTGGQRERGRTPHPPRSGPPVSLRLGHTRALSLPRSEIQSPRAASLPTGEGEGKPMQVR